jgi:hypothetical protein
VLLPVAAQANLLVVLRCAAAVADASALPQARLAVVSLLQVIMLVLLSGTLSAFTMRTCMSGA